MTFALAANGGTCTVTPSDTLTITLPAGLGTIPEGTGLTLPSFNDTGFTCTWASGIVMTQTSTCTPNGTITLTAGQAYGIHLPVIVSGSSGPLTSTISGLGGQTASMTIHASTCAVGAPLIDWMVGGVALAAAGALGGGLLLVRRRRRHGVAVA